MLSCLMLAVAGWAAWWQQRPRPSAGGLAWIALGMTLGFYGDSHVATRLWWPPFPHPILGGIVFFGLGHLAYIAGCLSFRRQHSIRLGWRWWRPIMIWQAVALLIWALIALTATREQGLRIPTLFYTLLVAGTPGFTAALARHQRRYVAMAIGGALFFVSDILLAYHLFHGPFPGIDPLTWTCYGGGQMLIVYGAIWANQQIFLHSLSNRSRVNIE
jgi:hypothetical protein